MNENTTHRCSLAAAGALALAGCARRRRRRRRRDGRLPSRHPRSRTARRWPPRRGGHDHDRHEVRPAAVRSRRPVGRARGLRRRDRQDHRRPSSASPRTTSSGSRPSRPTASRSSRTARSTSSSRRTRSTTSARRSSPSPVRTTWPGSRSSCSPTTTTSTSEDDLVGQPVCSVTGSTPAANLEALGAEVVLTDTYTQLPRAAAQRHRRRGLDRQRHPRRPRRPERGRVQGRRRAVHRGALRHRPRAGRHRVPRLDQRRARGRPTRTAATRRRGTPRPERCCRSSSRRQSTATDRSDARAGVDAGPGIRTPDRTDDDPRGGPMDSCRR